MTHVDRVDAAIWSHPPDWLSISGRCHVTGYHLTSILLSHIFFFNCNNKRRPDCGELTAANLSSGLRYHLGQVCPV